MREYKSNAFFKYITLFPHFFNNDQWKLNSRGAIMIKI